MCNLPVAFLNKVNDRIHKIGEEYQEEFLEKAKQLCVVKTVAELNCCLLDLRRLLKCSLRLGIS